MIIVYDNKAPPPGTLVGTAKIRATVTLDHDSDGFIARARLVLTDPSGNIIFTNTSPWDARQIRVEPLH